LIDFWADWCLPCKKFSPILDEIDQERQDINLVKVDSDDDRNEDLLREYDIRSIPTLILLDPDGNAVGQVTGARSKRDIQLWLDEKMGVLY
jgi:thioredoxin 1